MAEIPVEVGPTNARQHITGYWALSIPAPYRSMGGRSNPRRTWFASRPETLADREGLTDESTYGRLLDCLGRWGLRDARKGLAEFGHPGGESSTKIWAASHVRAVIEVHWEQLIPFARCGLVHPPYDVNDVAKLLPYPDQWIPLHWWAWRIETVMTASELELWRAWRRQWNPWARGPA